jgi:hypothetical protein
MTMLKDGVIRKRECHIHANCHLRLAFAPHCMPGQGGQRAMELIHVEQTVTVGVARVKRTAKAHKRVG